MKQVNIRQLVKMNARQLAKEPFEVVSRKKVIGRFVPARTRPSVERPDFSREMKQIFGTTTGASFDALLENLP